MYNSYDRRLPPKQQGYPNQQATYGQQYGHGSLGTAHNGPHAESRGPTSGHRGSSANGPLGSLRQPGQIAPSHNVMNPLAIFPPPHSHTGHMQGPLQSSTPPLSPHDRAGPSSLPPTFVNLDLNSNKPLHSLPIQPIKPPHKPAHVRNGAGPVKADYNNYANYNLYHQSDGTTTNTSSPSADSDFDSIRLDCLKKRVLYEDPQFPATDNSIYYSRYPPNRIEWKRPVEIARLYGVKPELFVDGGSRFDVKQGQLGDCWFVGALACICGPDHRDLLTRVMPDSQSFNDGWYAGVFRFQFWYFGKWTEVIIDDRLPTIQGRLAFVHSERPNEFWAALLEKAYAKLYGSYEALKGGVMCDALTDLSGGIAESYMLRGSQSNVPKNVVNILFKGLDRLSLIGCGINAVDGKLGESQLSNGLVAGHAYSLTDLREIVLMSDRGQIPITLIRVRNPWGSKIEWTGPWGDNSAEWRNIPPHERERMGLTFRDDGEFWMDFHDFMENFDRLDICNLTPDAPVEMPRQWVVVSHNGYWQKGFSAGGRPTCTDTHWTNPNYRMILRDSDEDEDNMCSFVVQLMQKDRRRLKNKAEKLVYIGFIIYKYSQSYSLPLDREFFNQNERVASCDMFVNTRQIVKRVNLPPGEYIIVPCTYDKNEEAAFFLRCFFETENTVEIADVPPGVVDVPPPISFEYDKEGTFKRYFYDISGEDMEVGPYELRTVINEALRKEKPACEIDADSCKAMVSLMDVDKTGRLGYPEFLFLWNQLRMWKNTFHQHDTSNNGMLISFELRTAIAAMGYKVSARTVQGLVCRYSDESLQISLGSFITCMARLMKLFNVFKTNQQNGHATFTLDKWLEEAVLV